MQNGTLSLAGDFSKDGANITLQLLSNPTKMFVNNYLLMVNILNMIIVKVITNYIRFSGVKLQKNLSAQKLSHSKALDFMTMMKKIDISKINTDDVKKLNLDSQVGNYTSFGLIINWHYSFNFATKISGILLI